MISDPANALGALAGKAHLKYLETKAVVGGTTAIQGTAKTGRPYEGWLVRNIEYETFQTKKKTVYVSALPLRDEAAYKSQAQHLKDKLAFVYHLSEGTDPKLISEYTTMNTEHCLAQGLAAIHCTALEKANYDEWAPLGGAVVWSPFSNLWLYAGTTDVLAARAAGVRICLGADWSPSGSKNLLGELKVADMWNRTHLNGELTAQEICEMATCNPADAINWGDKIGRLKAGLHGDVLVTTDRLDDPYENLVKSIERDVQLVAINGQPFYGTTKLMKAAGATRAEPISVGRLRRSVQLIYDDVPEADMGWKDVLADIAAAIKDPLGRYYELEKQHGNPDPEKRPLWLMTDKPWDDPKVTGKPVEDPAPGRAHPAAGLARPRQEVLRRRRGQPAARRAAQRPARLLRLGQRALGRRRPGSAACAGRAGAVGPAVVGGHPRPASRRAGHPSGSASCRRRRTPRRRGRGCGSCRGARSRA